MMAKKKKNRLAAIKKKEEEVAKPMGGFSMMPNDCDLGLSPGPAKKMAIGKKAGKMSPLMNAERSEFIGIRKK